MSDVWAPPDESLASQPIPGGPAPKHVRTHPLAIASLVCGILWCCGLTSIAAVVLGLIAVGAIRKNPDAFTGVGLAQWGVALGALGVVGMAGMWGFFGYRYSEVKPVCAEAIRAVASGNEQAMQAVLAKDLLESEEGPAQLANLREKLLIPLGPLQELTTGWGIHIQSDVTSVEFDGVFQNDNADVTCGLRSVADGYRVIQLTIKTE